MILLSLPPLTLIAGWLALPYYRVWKLQNFQTNARQVLQKTNFTAAWLSAQQALVLNATNLDTLRLLEEIRAVQHHLAALAANHVLGAAPRGKP